MASSPVAPDRDRGGRITRPVGRCTDAPSTRIADVLEPEPIMSRKVARVLGALGIAVVLLGAHAAAQDERIWRDEARGVVLRVPEHEWTRTTGSQGSSRHVIFDSEEREGTRLSLQTWSLQPEIGSLSQLCDFELGHWRSNGAVEELSRVERTVKGAAALALSFRRGEGEDGRLVEATYVIRAGVVYRIAAAVAFADDARLPDLVESLVEGIEWTEATRGAAPAVPFACEDPIAGNVLTVVNATGPDAAYRYLEALPGVARANGGLPIVLVVGERLSPTARMFLTKYRPERIRLVGNTHPELPDVEHAMDLWETKSTVVIAAKNLADAVPAAALAVRLDVPLLLAGPDLDERLRRLEPRYHLAVGEVDLPSDFEGERLLDPLAVAERAGGGSYLALCNVADGPGAATAVFAAALAAMHRGVVLPISEEVRIHRCALVPTAERPAGFDETAERWVTGAFRVGGGELSVAAATTGRIHISGAKSDRYGRPRLDLDGDRRFDAETEELRIGSSVRVDDRPCAFTVRYQTAFGHPGEGEALLVEPDPEGIRRSIRDFAARLDHAEHLAIVGTPDRIPFAIREAETYFSTLDIKQELASDAPYADLDDDRTLELAVGRILVPDLETGSAVLATSLAYHRFEGEWDRKASLLAPGFASAEGRGSLHWVWPESESLARGIAGDLEEAGIECDAFLRDRADLDAVLASMRGAGWIGHMNHSNETTWGIKPGAHIVSSDLPDLDGAPIVVDTGCSSAGVDLGVPLARTMPGRFFTLGAVAYLGNTRPASLGTEVAVQEMFNRLVSDGATVGQAYRDGRNLLAHLLTQGHLDPDLGEWTFDPGVYERAWGQFYILNLYGDPGLVPRLPRRPERSLVEVSLEETSQPDRLRLTVRRNGEGRVDPLLILPASGQGVPREAHLRTAPGLTYGIVPHFCLDRGSLSPMRSLLAVSPGAWVDVELPARGEDVVLELREGPAWTDRGFAVERDPGGRARLLAYVPLVRSSLEEGGGETLSRVVFDLVFSGAAGDLATPRREAGGHEPPERERRAPGRLGSVSEAARPVVERMRGRRHDPRARGLSRFELSLANPCPGVLKDTGCRISWRRGEEPRFELTGLPARMASFRSEVEEAFGFVIELVLNDPLAHLLSGSYDVDLASPEDGHEVLVLVPSGVDEGAEVVHLVVSDAGRLEQVRRHRFGVEEVTHLHWRKTPEGDVLVRMTTPDVKYGQPRIVELEHGEPVEGLRLPSLVAVRVPGILARPVELRPRYERVARTDP